MNIIINGYILEYLKNGVHWHYYNGIQKKTNKHWTRINKKDRKEGITKRWIPVSVIDKGVSSV